MNDFIWSSRWSVALEVYSGSAYCQGYRLKAETRSRSMAVMGHDHRLYKGSGRSHHEVPYWFVDFSFEVILHFMMTQQGEAIYNRTPNQTFLINQNVSIVLVYVFYKLMMINRRSWPDRFRHRWTRWSSRQHQQVCQRRRSILHTITSSWTAGHCIPFDHIEPISPGIF